MRGKISSGPAFSSAAADRERWERNNRLKHWYRTHLDKGRAQRRREQLLRAHARRVAAAGSDADASSASTTTTAEAEQMEQRARAAAVAVDEN